jgi:hypothetical protein
MACKLGDEFKRILGCQEEKLSHWPTLCIAWVGENSKEILWNYGLEAGEDSGAI